MAYNEKDGLKDFFGGMDDINKQNIKCVGEPHKRFNEDALRILRALRLSSKLGFGIDKNTSAAMFKNKDLLKNISAERINKEFNGLILGENTVAVLRDYIDIIKVFIPQISCISENSDELLWSSTLRAIEASQPDLIIRLFFLFKDISYEADKILKGLRYDNNTVLEISRLLSNYNIEIHPTLQNIKIWLNKLGEKTLRQIILIRCIDNLQKGKGIDSFLKIEELLNIIILQKQCYELKDLDLSGQDLFNMGIKDGKQIGEILNRILIMVINDELENKKAQLLNTVRQML
jgi:tRNA nucleotidyltransferase (CCA-adding enzyme)